jgi:hypothetical protein
MLSSAQQQNSLIPLPPFAASPASTLRILTRMDYCFSTVAEEADLWSLIPDSDILNK